MVGGPDGFDFQEAGFVSDGPGKYDEFLSDASQDGDGRFSLDKFYTASSDKKGRQTTIRIHVPPSLLRTISEVVARRVVPEYRTQHDVLRDLLVVGVNMRLEQIDDPDFKSTAEKLTVRAWLQTQMEMRDEDRRMVDDFERNMTEVKTPEEKERLREKARAVIHKVVDPDQKERLERLTW